MPRYIFNALSEFCFAREFEIHHLANLGATRHQAQRTARHFLAYLPRTLRQEALTIEIVEETGQEFAVVRLEAPF